MFNRFCVVNRLRVVSTTRHCSSTMAIICIAIGNQVLSVAGTGVVCSACRLASSLRAALSCSCVLTMCQ